MPSLAAAPSQAGRSPFAINLLGFRAEIGGPAAQQRALRRVFPPPPAWTVSAEAASTVAFQVQRDPAASGRYHVARDGDVAWSTADRTELLPYLEWAISTTAVEYLRTRSVLLHAGAVAHARGGIVLPAASGSGKSTLTAALVASGCQYFSDEVAALAPGTRELVPFARSLCLRQGGLAALAPLFPGLVAGVARRAPGDQSRCYLPPPAAAWPAAPVPVRLVVFPRYAAGARAVLRPLIRSAALPLLLVQSFGTQALGADGLGAIIALLRDAECFSLTFDDLREAVGLLLRAAS